MIIKPVLRLSSMPSVGQLSNPLPTSEVMGQVNAQYLNSGMVFGGQEDFLASAYNKFTEAYVQPALQTAEIIEVAEAYVTQKESMRYLYKEESFENVPALMYLPLLTHPPIRDMHDNGIINGWGIEAGTLPEEDIYGNVLKWGKCEILGNEEELEELTSRTWCSSDPELSDGEVDIVLESRRYMETFIAAEIEDGTIRDPTGWADELYLKEG